MLLQPDGKVGPGQTSFQFNADCESLDNGGTYTAQVWLCNGNCDEYGVARHPHTALYATTSTTFQIDISNCAKWTSK